MTDGTEHTIANVTPDLVLKALSENKNTALVDVRTAMEWERIGRPDIGGTGKAVHFVEWKQSPDMRINPDFAAQLEASLGGTYPEALYFICRSGVRSREAAVAIQDRLSSSGSDCRCINVAEGFEGDPDASGARGTINGWQARDLPWLSG